MFCRALAMLVCATLVGGCATAPPTVDRLPDGQSVKVTVTQAPANGALAIRNASFGKNVGTGASGGGLVGGLWGLACGPFIVICVPLGAGIGALAGTAGGAAAGATASLSSDKSARLRHRLSQSAVLGTLAEQLRANVSDRAARHWDLASEAPGHVLAIELGNVELTSTRDEQIGLSLHARAVLASGTLASGVKTSTSTLACSVPPSDLSIWLDEDNDFVDTVLVNCTQQLAAQLVAEMSRK